MATKRKKRALVTMLRRGKETWAEGERLAQLLLWYGDGHFNPVNSDELGSVKGVPEISIGRTDGKARLGFVVSDSKSKRVTDFTLSRFQVEALRDFCTYQLRRLNP